MRVATQSYTMRNLTLQPLLSDMSAIVIIFADSENELTYDQSSRPGKVQPGFLIPWNVPIRALPVVLACIKR